MVPTEDHNNAFWKFSWNLSPHPRISVLLWRLFKMDSPLKQTPMEYHLICDQTCSMCGGTTETSSHCFFIACHLMPNQSILAWFMETCRMLLNDSNEGSQLIHQLIVTLLAIWHFRNKKAFHDTLPNPKEVIHFIWLKYRIINRYCRWVTVTGY